MRLWEKFLQNKDKCKGCRDLQKLSFTKANTTLTGHILSHHTPLTLKSYKPIWNCHNEFPLYNEYILIKNLRKKTPKNLEHWSIKSCKEHNVFWSYMWESLWSSVSKLCNNKKWEWLWIGSTVWLENDVIFFFII
jgi:hypothetical protein